MDFTELTDEDFEEKFSLDGVYEEITLFQNIPETLFQKIQSEGFKASIFSYLEPKVN